MIPMAPAELGTSLQEQSQLLARTDLSLIGDHYPIKLRHKKNIILNPRGKAMSIHNYFMYTVNINY